MKTNITSRVLELLGLAAVAIGITVGLADAHGDISHCDACTDVPTHTDIQVPTESAESVVPISMMVSPPDDGAAE